MRGSQSRAKEYALKLLSYRGRSEKELEDRLLRKGISKPDASSAIEYLKGIGLIDDVTFAETLMSEAVTTKMLSRNGARRYMLSRGLSRDIVDRISSDSEDTDFVNAGKLVEKKLRVMGKCPSLVAKKRLYAHLLRRGYSSEIIARVLREKNFKEED